MSADIGDISEQTSKYDNHPREHVTWDQAVAFCRWLSDKVGYEVRLPQEYEWEVAARFDDGRFYPWGNNFDPHKANTAESGAGQTTAVGLYPSGRQPILNLYGLSGNVWEWCQNEYDDTTREIVDASGDSRVLRGGSWAYNQGLARGSYRGRLNPYALLNSYGFRVCRRPPSS